MVMPAEMTPKQAKQAHLESVRAEYMARLEAANNEEARALAEYEAAQARRETIEVMLADVIPTLDKAITDA